MKIKKIKGIVFVNKNVALPKAYNPGLNNKMMKMYIKMQKCAQECGFELPIVSSFRSYNYQKKVYDEYVKEFGMSKTNTFSAKPGHSEHQTGLALDIGEDNDDYIKNPESKWLRNNAHKFGFIIRYPKGKEWITGYKYEPWHIRYVGVKHATKIYNKKITLEELIDMKASSFWIVTCWGRE